MSIKHFRSWPRGLAWFVALWGVLLLFPPLNRIVLQCWDWNRTGALTPRRSFQTQEAPPFDAELIRARRPNNPHFLAQALDAQMYAAQRANDIESPYYWLNNGNNPTPPNPNRAYSDAINGHFVLVQRYPKEEWLRARTLQLVTEQHFEVDAGKILKSSHNRVLMSMSATQRQNIVRGLQLARTSGARFPDNAFFPMLESGFAFALNRNDEALKALDRAAQAKRFDDFAALLVQDRLRAAELEKPLQWEDRIQITSQVTFAYMSTVRQATWVATQLGINAWKQGRKAEALDSWNDITIVSQQISAMPNRELRQSDFWGMLIAGTMWSDVTQALVPEALRGVRRGDLEARFLVASQAFAALCRQAGARDLAERATAGALQFKARNDEMRRGRNFIDPQHGIEGVTAALAFYGRIAGGFLLRVSLLGMLIWAVLVLWAKPGNGPILRRLDAVAACLFCLVALGVWFYLQILTGSLLPGFGEEPQVGEQIIISQASTSYALLLLCAASYTLALGPAAWFAWRGKRREKLTGRGAPDDQASETVSKRDAGSTWFARFWWLMALWFVALFVAPVSVWEALFPSGPWLSQVIFLLMLIGGVLWSVVRLRREIRPKVALLLSGLLPHLIPLFVAIFFHRRIPSYSVWSDVVSYGGWLLTIGCVAGALVWMVRERTYPSLRGARWELPLPRRFVVIYADIARNFALGCTLLFLLLACVLWPVRARAEAEFEQKIDVTHATL